MLSRADAELAAQLIPLEWGEDMPHAYTTIWALYERQVEGPIIEEAEAGSTEADATETTDPTAGG